MKLSAVFCVCIFTIVAALFFVVDSWGVCDWSTWRPASCLSTSQGCFCEHLRAPSECFRQVGNTYSNLGFVAVGLWILATPPAHPNLNLYVRMPSVYHAVFGFSVVGMGLASAVYHASLTWFGQWWDLMVMYIIINFVLVWNLTRVSFARSPGTHPNVRLFVVLFTFLNVLCGVVQMWYPFFRRQLFGYLLLTSLLMDWLSRKQARKVLHTQYLSIDSKWLWIAFLGFVGSWTIWLLDVKHIYCGPLPHFQGHAIWHLGCAACLGALYLLLRSEKVLKPSID